MRSSLYLVSMLVASAATAQSDSCPPVLDGRPSKATIRSIEARIACLERSAEAARDVSVSPGVGGPRSAPSSTSPGIKELIQEVTRDLIEKHLREQFEEQAKPTEAEQLKEQASSQRTFDEFANGNWSVGAVHTPGRQRITDAIVDSGVVRVKKTEDPGLRPAVVFTPPMRVGPRDKEKYSNTNGFKHRFGWGPMFMATPSVLDVDRNSDWVLGAGLMLAVRTDQRGSSLGIGVAYGVERSRMLREDFRPNELAPTDSRGVLQPIFEDRTTDSWMFVVAFSVGNANRANGEQ